MVHTWTNKSAGNHEGMMWISGLSFCGAVSFSSVHFDKIRQWVRLFLSFVMEYGSWMGEPVRPYSEASWLYMPSSPNVNTWCVQAYELVQGALVIYPSFLHRCTNTHMVYDATKPSNVEPLNRNLVNVDTYKFTKSWLDLPQETLYCLFFRIF
jgi:hypothetical protein